MANMLLRAARQVGEKPMTISKERQKQILRLRRALATAGEPTAVRWERQMRAQLRSEGRRCAPNDNSKLEI